MAENKVGKRWYTSRTFWINLIALVAFLLQTHLGFELTSEETAAVLVVINMIMRAITEEPLKWGE